MKCVRVHLQERHKVKIKPELPELNTKPRRYCQKRLVNREEETTWNYFWERTDSSNNKEVQIQKTEESGKLPQDNEDLVLTVQTLKLESDPKETNQQRPRTSFKYKVADSKTHRMFVRQAIAENDNMDDDRSSQFTYYYIDDYLKYLHNSDRSRPTSGKSSILMKGIVNSLKDNKVSQIKVYNPDLRKAVYKNKPKINNTQKKDIKNDVVIDVPDNIETFSNTTITYQKSTRRKSLTISRNESPETVQIIRVDVVCNHLENSPSSDCKDMKDCVKSPEKSLSKLESINMKYNHFSNKYLLTNSIKSLEARLSGGSKVTLLCKTFKLSDRTSRTFEKFNINKKYKTDYKNRFK